MIAYIKSLFAGKPAKPEDAKKRSSQWPKVRAAWLKDNPTCAVCGTKEKLEVHHVYPFGWPDGAKLELDVGNLVTLCENPGNNHHLLFGHLGDYKSRNPAIREDAVAMLAKIKARPYPPKEERQ